MISDELQAEDDTGVWEKHLDRGLVMRLGRRPTVISAALTERIWRRVEYFMARANSLAQSLIDRAYPAERNMDDLQIVHVTWQQSPKPSVPLDRLQQSSAFTDVVPPVTKQVVQVKPVDVETASSPKILSECHVSRAQGQPALPVVTARASTSAVATDHVMPSHRLDKSPSHARDDSVSDALTNKVPPPRAPHNQNDGGNGLPAVPDAFHERKTAAPVSQSASISSDDAVMLKMPPLRKRTTFPTHSTHPTPVDIKPFSDKGNEHGVSSFGTSGELPHSVNLLDLHDTAHPSAEGDLVDDRARADEIEAVHHGIRGPVASARLPKSARQNKEVVNTQWRNSNARTTATKKQLHAGGSPRHVVSPDESWRKSTAGEGHAISSSTTLNDVGTQAHQPPEIFRQPVISPDIDTLLNKNYRGSEVPLTAVDVSLPQLPHVVQTASAADTQDSATSIRALPLTEGLQDHANEPDNSPVSKPLSASVLSSDPGKANHVPFPPHSVQAPIDIARLVRRVERQIMKRLAVDAERRRGSS